MESLPRRNAIKGKPLTLAYEAHLPLTVLSHSLPSPPASRGGEEEAHFCVSKGAAVSVGLRPEFSNCRTDSLDEFLLERYTAFTQQGAKGRLFRIWHEPWPQMAVDISLVENSLLRNAGAWANSAKSVGANYSPGVQNVWMGRPHPIEPCRGENRVLSAFFEMP